MDVDGFNDVMRVEVFETSNYSYGFHCEKEKESIEMDGCRGRGKVGGREKMRSRVLCVEWELCSCMGWPVIKWAHTCRCVHVS